MVFKKKKKIAKPKIEDDLDELEDEEAEEEEDEVEEEEDEPHDKKLPALPNPNKTMVSKPNRPEIEDMIEGHLLRSTELLRLLRSTQ